MQSEGFDEGVQGEQVDGDSSCSWDDDLLRQELDSLLEDQVWCTFPPDNSFLDTAEFDT